MIPLSVVNGYIILSQNYFIYRNIKFNRQQNNLFTHNLIFVLCMCVICLHSFRLSYPTTKCGVVMGSFLLNSITYEVRR